MYDCPYTAEQDPQYVTNVLEPLDKDEGVACFVVDAGAGNRTVLYCSHKMDDEAKATSTDTREFVRAAQAVIFQREARQQAAKAGFRPLVA
jgi:hypothetical protein